MLFSWQQIPRDARGKKRSDSPYVRAHASLCSGSLKRSGQIKAASGWVFCPRELPTISSSGKEIKRDVPAAHHLFPLGSAAAISVPALKNSGKGSSET